MPKKPVFLEVVAAIEQRIAAGDYMLKDLPGERKLGEEVGVSYMTARKAVTTLIDRGVLARRPNGSLVVNPTYGMRAAPSKVALLTPAYPSLHLLQCRSEVSRAAELRGVQFRPVEYMHWYDPIVTDVIAGADGVFVIPNTEPIPPRVLASLKAPENRVVFLDDDMTAFGIPSVRFFTSHHIEAVFEHVWKLGHRAIDCLNTQGHSREIVRRIDEWRAWTQRHGIAGELHDAPVVAYADATAAAHRAMRKMLGSTRLRATAMVCTTQPAALGAIRACHDAGLVVGRDISIATINCEPTGRFFCPSLTGLEAPKIAPLLDQCFEWFEGAHRPWAGSLGIVPVKPRLFVGESTGRVSSPDLRAG